MRQIHSANRFVVLGGRQQMSFVFILDEDARRSEALGKMANHKLLLLQQTSFGIWVLIKDGKERITIVLSVPLGYHFVHLCSHCSDVVRKAVQTNDAARSRQRIALELNVLVNHLLGISAIFGEHLPNNSVDVGMLNTVGN
jgi:hypothetical protein